MEEFQEEMCAARDGGAASPAASPVVSLAASLAQEMETFATGATQNANPGVED